MHVEVEEVLDRRDLAQWFQLVLVALAGLHLLRGRRALLLKHVGGRLPLVEPELPVRLQRVSFLRHKLILYYAWDFILVHDLFNLLLSG